MLSMSRRVDGARWAADSSLKFRVNGVFVNEKMTVSLAFRWVHFLLPGYLLQICLLISLLKHFLFRHSLVIVMFWVYIFLLLLYRLFSSFLFYLSLCFSSFFPPCWGCVGVTLVLRASLSRSRDSLAYIYTLVQHAYCPVVTSSFP